MKTRPFNLEEALAGKPVWHIGQSKTVKNLTKVGNRVAYTIEAMGDTVFSCPFDGKSADGLPTLGMVVETRTFWVNLYDSPSFHYRKYLTKEQAENDNGMSYAGRKFPKLNKEPIEITQEVE